MTPEQKEALRAELLQGSQQQGKQALRNEAQEYGNVVQNREEYVKPRPVSSEDDLRRAILENRPVTLAEIMPFKGKTIFDQALKYVIDLNTKRDQVMGDKIQQDMAGVEKFQNIANAIK